MPDSKKPVDRLFEAFYANELQRIQARTPEAPSLGTLQSKNRLTLMRSLYAKNRDFLSGLLLAACLLVCASVSLNAQNSGALTRILDAAAANGAFHELGEHISNNARTVAAESALWLERKTNKQ